MKKLFLLFSLLPMFLHAGVIVKHSGDRLEDVSIKSVTATEIVYIAEDGKEASISKSEISAVLYDDGRYEEFKQASITQQEPVAGNDVVDPQTPAAKKEYTPAEITEGSKEYNVFAYGVYGGIGYFASDKYNDVVVEYRVIYDSQTEEPEFQYLGTTPFAYATEKFTQSSFAGKLNAKLMNIVEPKALVIANEAELKAVEFRLSKPGYKTTVVKPFKDYIIGGGPVMYISLDKLKASVGDDNNNPPTVGATPKVVEPAPKAADSTPIVKDSNKKMIPKICYEEGQKAYAAFEKALKIGYSKGQAYSIAGDAGVEAKQKAIDECYETRVVKGIY